MSPEIIKSEDIRALESKIGDVRNILREAGNEISETAKMFSRLDEFLGREDDKVFEVLDSIHIKLKDAHDKVMRAYDDARKGYSTIRDAGIRIIDLLIVEIKDKKAELLELEYKIDELIRCSEPASRIIAEREKEVVLFNSIEDCYRSALTVTTALKDVDSKANLLGYEFAEFSGKLYGLNNMLIIISSSLDDSKQTRAKALTRAVYASAGTQMGRSSRESENYIR